MSDQTPTELQCGAYDRGVPWKLFRKWWPSSRNSSHDVGLPPSLEAGDAWWLSLAAATWPGFVPAPLFVPYMSRLSQQPGQKISKETCKWTVSLDVAHFSPTEIFLSVKDGFLQSQQMTAIKRVIKSPLSSTKTWKARGAPTQTRPKRQSMESHLRVKRSRLKESPVRLLRRSHQRSRSWSKVQRVRSPARSRRRPTSRMNTQSKQMTRSG